MEELLNQFVEDLFSSYFQKLETQHLVLDFSDNFRKTKVKKMKPQKKAKRPDNPPPGYLTPLEDILNVDPNSDFDPLTSGIRPRELAIEAPVDLPVTFEIPEDLHISKSDMQARKYFDVARWHCLSRPQYRKSCGISSLVSCWNFLFSTLGHGSVLPLSQEKALTLLGIEPPFGDIKFGSFTGNDTLIQWFKQLCLHFNVPGSARMFWKMHGKNRTVGLESDQAFENLASGLQSPRQAFIYHCHNHYFCPIGYEISPMIQTDAYKPIADIDPSETERWVIIGEPSKCYASIQPKKWDEIAKDISTQNPQYRLHRFFNIRKPELGVQERTSEEFKSGKKLGGNLHCIIVFEVQEETQKDEIIYD